MNDPFRVGLLPSQKEMNVFYIWYPFCNFRYQMGTDRFELSTSALSARCSTTELCSQRWAGRDLNPRRLSQRIYSPPPLTTRTPTLDGVSVIHLKDVTEAYPLSRYGILVYLSSASSNSTTWIRTRDQPINSRRLYR